MPVIFRDKQVIDNIRPRIQKDTYLTPMPLAAAAVQWLNKINMLASGDWVLDPGAGRGVWGKAIVTSIPDRGYAGTYGIEWRAYRQPNLGYETWYNRKRFQDFATTRRFHWIIGNPPFNQAEEFVRIARYMLTPSGSLMFLLPTEFSHTQGRGRGLFKEYRPLWEIALLQRPNFSGPNGESLGSANTDNYILMVWGSESASETRKDWLDWKMEAANED